MRSFMHLCGRAFTRSFIHWSACQLLSIDLPIRLSIKLVAGKLFIFSIWKSKYRQVVAGKLFFILSLKSLWTVPMAWYPRQVHRLLSLFCGMSLNTYSTLAVLGKDVAKGWWTLLAHKACRLPYAANSRAQVHKRVDVIAWRFYSPAYFSVLISPSIDFTYPDTTKATNLATKKKRKKNKRLYLLSIDFTKSRIPFTFS